MAGSEKRAGPEYLRPLARSPRDVKSPVIARPEQTKHVVFACDRPLHALHGTAAGRYIAAGMQATVRVRGTDETVQGFHRAPRLVRAGRQPWYNLSTGLAKRGTYEILLPRRTFESYRVIHNRAGVAGNEDFIELHPLAGQAAVEPLLAFLNCSVGEFLVRSHSFQYGGGVFNLNPGAVRAIPVLDPRRLMAGEREALAAAWAAFVAHAAHEGIPRPRAREALDAAVASVLHLPPGLCQQVSQALQQLVQLASAAGAALHPTGAPTRCPWP